uniref:Secreted protein n=2 Tax=Ascaris lumbricoides TaxID=6252 RepID=A0A0M3HLV6_ASCLU
MRSALSLLLLVAQLPYPVGTQVAEIASLVTGIVAPQLISGAGGGAAGAATGALGGIGSC